MPIEGITEWGVVLLLLVLTLFLFSLPHYYHYRRGQALIRKLPAGAIHFRGAFLDTYASPYSVFAPDRIPIDVYFGEQYLLISLLYRFRPYPWGYLFRLPVVVVADHQVEYALFGTARGFVPQKLTINRKGELYIRFDRPDKSDFVRLYVEPYGAEDRDQLQLIRQSAFYT